MFSLSGLSPSEGKRSVSLNSLIEFTIVDDESGIDSSSLVVDIQGSRALENLTFKNGYNGEYSEINPIGSNLSVIIDPESNFQTGSVVEVKVQVKSLSGKFFNTNYVFATIKKEPELVLMSPSHGDIIKTQQVLYLEFKDEVDGVNSGTIDVKVNDVFAIKGGIPQAGFTQSGISEVKQITNGAIVKIDPEEIFCNSFFLNSCTSSFNGIFYYYDDDHLTRDGARLVVDEILKYFDIKKNQ